MTTSTAVKFSYLNIFCLSLLSLLMCLLSSTSMANTVQAKIANGVNTTINQAPWQVAIATLSKNTDGSFSYSRFCAGTLISDSWVVTAAHCFYDSKNRVNTHIIVGQSELTANVPLNAFVKVNRLVERSDFNPKKLSLDQTNFDNDIILLKLDQAIDLKNCNNCKVANWSNNSADSNVNTAVFVAGWGATTKASASNILQSTTLNIVQCVSNKTGASYTVAGQAVSDNTICAQSTATPPSDTCPGDSGSGLIAKYGSTPILVGITSFSIKGDGSVTNCDNSKEFPGGYTKVSNYCQWIQSNTGINNNCVASDQANLTNSIITSLTSSTTTTAPSTGAATVNNSVSTGTTTSGTTSTNTNTGGGSGGGATGWGELLGLMLSAAWLRRLRQQS